MKNFVLFLTFCFLCLFHKATHAQHISLTTKAGVTASFANINPNFYAFDKTSFAIKIANESKWKKLKTAGIVLTSVGAGCIAGGVALIAQGAKTINSNSYGYDNGDATVAVGVCGIAGGLTAIGGGITMWAIGNNRLKKLNGRLSFNTGPRSAYFVYKF